MAASRRVCVKRTPNLFGFGFVTAEDYEALKAGGQNFRTEDYTYTYLLNDTKLRELTDSALCKLQTMTDDEFAELELYPDFDQ